MFAKTFILLALQFLAGFGLLTGFGYRGRLGGTLGLSLIIGMGLSTLGIYLLEVAGLSLTLPNVYLSTGLFVLLGLFPLKARIEALRELYGSLRWPQAYDLLVWALVLYIFIPSAWRAYYLPVDPHDSLVGPDLIAKYAVEQGRFVNSAFTDSWIATFHRGQMFYAPFTAMMQIIYRLLGFPFGQVWLSVLWMSFLLFFYDRLRDYVHPVLAGLMLAVLLALPELYAYTFLLQTDFANMVFFCTGVVLFADWAREMQWRKLLLSALVFGFAVWSRSEGVFFLGVGAALVLGLAWRRVGAKTALLQATAFGAIPVVFFLLWNVLFFRFYLPYPPDNSKELALANLANIPKLFQIMEAMVNTVMLNTIYWGYFLYGFLVLFALNLLIYRDTKGLHILAWALILFVMFAVVINIFPLANVPFTFRRGYFKFFPILLLYLAHTSLFQHLSSRLKRWELKSS